MLTHVAVCQPREGLRSLRAAILDPPEGLGSLRAAFEGMSPSGDAVNAQDCHTSPGAGRISSMIVIDEYAGRPRVDSASGIILGRKLVKHASRGRSVRLNSAIEEVRERTVDA